MIKTPIISALNNFSIKLKKLVTEKEEVREKLEVTAEELEHKAEQLAVVAKEKEDVREKLEVTATELKHKAEQLAVVAKEKEKTRKELTIIKKDVDAALKYAEDIIDTVREPMLALDQDLRVVKVNQSFYDFFKVNPKETVGQHIYNLGNKQWNIPELRKLLEEILPQKTTFDDYKVEHNFATIGKRTMLLNARQIKRGEGMERIILLAIEDITEKRELDEKLAEKAAQLAVVAQEKEDVRKKLEVTAKELRLKAEQLATVAENKESVRKELKITAEELNKSHKTLEQKVIDRTKDLSTANAKDEALLLSIGDGVIATDEEGKVIVINNAAELLLKRGAVEFIGKKLLSILDIYDEFGVIVPAGKRPLHIALTHGKATTATIYFYERKDGIKFPVAVAVTPVILNKKIIGSIEVFRDITHEKDIDKAKTEFVSLASHQLRTPLSTVNWYTEMLLTGDVGKLNAVQKKYLDQVYSSNKRMVALVNALLNVSRLEMGTLIIEPKPVNVVKEIENTINEYKKQIDIKKIKLSCSVEKRIPIISADPKILHIVIENIFSNAVKYTPERGKIKLTASLSDKKNILLEISDTGYGIPKNQQDKIFTKLFRADNVREKDTDGTGLGLYIAKSIIENFEGKIWFTSQENKGTTFFITIPIAGMTKKQGTKTLITTL